MATIALDRLASHWQWALDTADRAVDAAHVLPEPIHRQAPPHERESTATLLRAVAAEHPGAPLPWLSPVPVTPWLLGLPADTRACLFDLDGVLTDSGVLHAWAWEQVFDDFLLARSSPRGLQFAPFDPVDDYRVHLDGRPRLDGIRAFLASRGIEPSRAEAQALARRKGDLLAQGMRRRGVAALDGARRYLAAAGHARLGRAVVSASTTTLPMLELAQLTSLVDARVDAETLRERGLRPRPAPDILLAACERLKVDPSRAVTLTHTAAGVAAGHAADLTAIRIGQPGHPSLGALLDTRLRST